MDDPTRHDKGTPVGSHRGVDDPGLLWTAINAVPGVLYLFDESGNFILWNRQLEIATGYSTDELADMHPLDFFRGDDVVYLADRIAQVFEHGASDADAIFVAKDGSRTPYHFAAIRAEYDRRPCCVTMGTNVAARKAADDALRKSEAMFRAVTENAHDMLTIIATDGSILYDSPSFGRAIGYMPEEIAGLDLFGIVHPDDRELIETAIADAMSKPALSSPVEYRVRHKAGAWRIFSTTGTNMIGDPAVGGFVATTRDVTETRAAEERVRYLAHHDTLTGLANRHLMQDRIDQAVTQSVRDGHRGAVLFVDLDRFKIINDSLGHRRGDQVLVAVARRLEKCLRDTDTVARHGGDEFVILLRGVDRPHDVGLIALKIQEAVSQSFTIEGTELHVTPSIGICMYPLDGGDSSTLIRHADIAMYQAKELGRNNFQFFTADMNARVLEDIEIENDLRRALRLDEFRLEYQPVVDVAAGLVTGFEALIRWSHPQKGIVMPGSFVRIAEETGLIIPIGNIVLRRACADAKQWHDAGFRDLTVHVNMSGHFRRMDIVASVVSALEDTKLNPRFLSLELTERMVMVDVDNATNMLDDLNAIGVRVSIDDFGTGYSSLSCLKRLPIHALKIDRSFVNEITTDRDNAAIVGGIIALANSINAGVIAEGVETEEQLAFLRTEGCDEMQGFLFAHPMPPDTLSRGLAKWGTALDSLAKWAHA